MPSAAQLQQQHLSSMRTALLDPDTFATTLTLIVADLYGERDGDVFRVPAFEWDPATVRMELEDDFNIKLPTATFDKLMVGIQLVTTDDFYRSLPDFINICNVLSGGGLDPSNWDPADADEVAWGITEALLLGPPDDQNDEDMFDPEIRAYMGKVLDDRGIMTPPDIMQLAVRPDDMRLKVHGEFSDDPTMYSAIFGAEGGKTDDINNFVKYNLKSLMMQLKGLRLHIGDAAAGVAKLIQQGPTSSGGF